MEYKKVYAILHNSYEFDDLNYGELTPVFMSLNKDRVIEKFNKIKEQEINWFYKTIKDKEEWFNKYPEDKEDYQIAKNTDDEFELYVGNWCYKWVLEEYDLN